MRQEMWKWRAKVLKELGFANRSKLTIRKMQIALAREIERDLKEGKL